jgi:hypothetical protein
MIVQVINQLIVAYTIQAAMGWISGGSSSKSGQSLPFLPIVLPVLMGAVLPGMGEIRARWGCPPRRVRFHQRGDQPHRREQPLPDDARLCFRRICRQRCQPGECLPWRCDGQHGGVYISSGSEQQSTQRSAIDSNGILKQLKPAIITSVNRPNGPDATLEGNKRRALIPEAALRPFGGDKGIYDY